MGSFGRLLAIAVHTFGVQVNSYQQMRADLQALVADVLFGPRVAELIVICLLPGASESSESKALA